MSNNKETVIEDFLDEDTEIPGQKYVLLSFLSPEKVLEKKDIYFFKKFLESYEVDWKTKNLEKYLVDVVRNINEQLDNRIAELEKNNQIEQADLCRKNRVNITEVMSTYQQFVKTNHDNITKTSLTEAYDTFMYSNKKKLEEEFYALNDFTTSMRGIKVRGVYGNTKEAELKAKKLQQKDKYHNIYLGEVGKWTPWDPQPHEIENQEYAQDELNSLMRKYKENEDNREQYFNTNKELLAKNVNKTPFNSMFDESKDLALERKMEKAALTEDTSSATNTVVNP